MLIDTHCHLDFPEYGQDRDEVISRARSQGIGRIINIGTDPQSCRNSLELSGRYEFIYSAVGIHPHDADKIKQADLEAVRKMAREEKVVAIGETGLDYYRNYSQPQNQKELFSALIALAQGLKLPLVVHSRNAEEDTLKILKEANPEKVVIHCFSGDQNFLKACLRMGFFISFTCNIGYKKAQALREAVRLTPIERLFLETDAPFLPPEGMRGRRNEPAYIKLLAEEVARIKGLSPESVADSTTANAKSFFNLS